MRYLFFMFLFFTVEISLIGQSPSDLISDIAESHGFSTVADIAASFNNARRQEEIQLGLGTNAIQDLEMPDQVTWDIMNNEEKALYLLNDERVARMGVNYGSGPVDGYPFEGVGQNLTLSSQNYAEYLMNNNQFTHCPTPSNCPTDRINAAVGSGCSEFIPYTENLYAGVNLLPNHTFPDAIASGIYNWSYKDDVDNWGHRRMNLFQGFNENYGDSDKRGIIGIGIKTGGPYLGWASGVVFVFNYFDPVSSCNEVLSVDTDDLPGSCPDNTLTLNGDIPSGTYNSNHIEADGTVSSTSDVMFEATTTATLMELFEVEYEGILTVYITGCD